MARVLQYLETPQYLRKALFPVHPDLKYAGLLNPLDAPHHVRAMQDSLFREGVVVKRPVALDKGSGGAWANVGLKKEVSIDRHIPSGVRVTVQIINPEGSATRKVVNGTAVAPSVPREKHGMYWGYTTRMANSFGEVWSKSPYKGGYDLSVGTSDRGSDATSPSFVLPAFRHLLIVFGGLTGLESCLQADEQLEAKTPDELFDLYVNTCPNQGSRTIRTEEAIPITLSVLTAHFRKNKLPS
jgi:predicted SPOUT superfamily RNA methylase MTH1